MSLPKARLNILRNGQSSGGKVVLKPDEDNEEGFQALLSRCSAKFNNAQIDRIYNLDGFEVDELECIDAGDTLVAVACGEEFINPQAPRGVCSLSSLSSSMPGSSLQSSFCSLPTDAASVTYADTSQPAPSMSPSPQPPTLQNNNTNSGVDAAPPPSLLPKLHAHLTVLQAAPLTSRGADGKERALPFLSLTSERETLLDALRYSGRQLAVQILTATTDALVTAMTMGTTVLHYSGHGEEATLAFEDGGGGSHAVAPQLLASACCGEDSPLKLVFVCACHSQTAAAAFLRAGVQHVVAVRSHALILDAAAIQFTKHFYLSLSRGKSVAEAFDAARTAVRTMPKWRTSNQPAEAESAKFVLLPENGDHSAPIFDLAAGDLVDRSAPLCSSNVPTPSGGFVGRQLQMHRAVAALSGSGGKRRIICLVGAGGIGKSALATAVCDFVRVRHVFPDGTYHIDARGLEDVLMLLQRVSSALQITAPADADERILREGLFTALAHSTALIYIDCCDMLTSTELAPQFGEFVSGLLARAPKVRLLLTCRRGVGVANEQPLNLAVPELSAVEAKQMLQSMARVPSTHAATLAELCGGMPLALRLCGCALSRANRLITPDQLIKRLEGETRRLSELHQLSETTGDPSVEACIASSYDALPPKLQLAFLALCEFPGSFPEAAAAAVLCDGLLEDAPESQALLAHLRAEAVAAAAAGVGAATPRSPMAARARTAYSDDGVSPSPSPIPSPMIGVGDDDWGVVGAPPFGPASEAGDDDASSMSLAEISAAAASGMPPAAPPLAQRQRSGRLSDLMAALVDDSMVELLPMAPAPSAGASMGANTTVAAAATQASSRRYRLHELIRLFGSGVLARAGDAGRAAQARWREAIARFWTGWLEGQSELWSSAQNVGAIRAFDTERHNIEATLAVARDACTSHLPLLLTAGRLLLRQRLDPGSRRSLFATALDRLLVAPTEAPTEVPTEVPSQADGTLADGVVAGAGDVTTPCEAPEADAASARVVLAGSVETAACVLIELGYCAGEQSRRVEGAAHYAKAILLVAGDDAGGALLREAGVAKPANAPQQAAAATAAATAPPAGAQAAIAAAAVAVAAAPAGSRVVGESVHASFKDAAASAAPRASSSAALPAASGSSGNAAAGGSGSGNGPGEPLEESERTHEEQLLQFLQDSEIAPYPLAAESELCAESLNMLAINLDGQGLFRGSQVLFIHAIRIRRKLLGNNHVDTAATYNNLANLLRKPAISAIGRVNRERGTGSRVVPERHLSTHRFCEALYRRTLAIREKSFGKDSPQLAASCSNLAVLLQHSEPKLPEHVDEAERLLNRGLAIRRAVFGDEHSETAASYHLLGTLKYYHRNDLDAAERLYQRALELRVKYFSRHSDRAGQTLFNLANLARSKGEEERAEALYVECLEIREEILGGPHVDSIKTAQQLAKLYGHLNRHSERRRLHERIAEWQRARDAAAGDGAWLKAEVPFPSATAVPEDFHLRSRIYGARGYSIKHIMQQSGVEKLVLRFVPFGTESEGGGAQGGAQGGTAGDGPDLISDGMSHASLDDGGPPPLLAHASSIASSTSSLGEGSGSSVSGEQGGQARLCIQATSGAALRKATELCQAHLQKIAADLERWSRGQRGGGRTGFPQRSQSDSAVGRAGSSGSLTLADFIKPTPSKPKGKGKGAR